ncbi:bZIP transcription factor 1 [Phytophthora citrophthora]|uniref:BZIP transcription factor 1 n=1 Tax=Phytophthora citrophthora TaxID=4793 RepID=A0AAD9GCF3_9STRA|nr:bZIP transcription factor 1 [Phytophthora citrophthora]
MPPSSLYPPTILSLSEDVIGSVKQRISPPHRYLDRGNNRPTKSQRFISTTSPRSLLLSDKNSQDEEVEQEVAETRRKRIRINQARYRQKLQKKPEQLERCIQQLTEQVQHLEGERDQAVGGDAFQKTVWTAAVEYFRIFTRGWTAPAGANIVAMTLLKTLISSDVAFSGGIGLDALVHSWRVFTQYFPDVHLQVKNLKELSSDLVYATTTTAITLSDTAMGNAFPHLTNGGAGGRCSWLAERLGGQRLVLHGSVRFHWDNITHRLVEIQAQTDLVSPFLALLENLEDVSLAFAYALITPEGNLVE